MEETHFKHKNSKKSRFNPNDTLNGIITKYSKKDDEPNNSVFPAKIQNNFQLKFLSKIQMDPKREMHYAKIVAFSNEVRPRIAMIMRKMKDGNLLDLPALQYGNDMSAMDTVLELFQDSEQNCHIYQKAKSRSSRSSSISHADMTSCLLYIYITPEIFSLMEIYQGILLDKEFSHMVLVTYDELLNFVLNSDVDVPSMEISSDIAALAGTPFFQTIPPFQVRTRSFCALEYENSPKPKNSPLKVNSPNKLNRMSTAPSKSFSASKNEDIELMCNPLKDVTNLKREETSFDQSTMNKTGQKPLQKYNKKHPKETKKTAEKESLRQKRSKKHSHRSKRHSKSKSKRNSKTNFIKETNKDSSRNLEINEKLLSDIEIETTIKTEIPKRNIKSSREKRTLDEERNSKQNEIEKKSPKNDKTSRWINIGMSALVIGLMYFGNRKSNQ